jgi:hypothetical protein
MNRARNVTDPVERNMMIPLQQFADGGVELIRVFMTPLAPSLDDPMTV